MLRRIFRFILVCLSCSVTVSAVVSVPSGVHLSTVQDRIAISKTDGTDSSGRTPSSGRNGFDARKSSIVSIAGNKSGPRGVRCCATSFSSSSSENRPVQTNALRRRFIVLETGVNRRDNMGQANHVYYSIYVETLGLLVLAMRKWLDGAGGNDTATIGTYLGYGRPTTDLIDVVVTLLLRESRRTVNMTVDGLIETYYYSCDVANVSGGVDAVRRTFGSLLDKHSWINDWLADMTESALVERLKTSLGNIAEDSKPRCNVTVGMMKNRVLVEPTEKKTVKRLQDRPVNGYGPGLTNLRELAVSCSKETRGKTVTENHLRIVSQVIPNVFGYAYNHVELLSLLDDDVELDATDVNTINEFSTFVDRFTAIFTDHYFGINGNADELLQREMMSLNCFLYPRVVASPSGRFSCKNFSGNSIEKFYGNSKKRGSLKQELNGLMETALEHVLYAFGKLDRKKWRTDRSSTIDYPAGKLTKDDVLKLIKINADDGFEILDAFSSYGCGNEKILK